MNVRLESGNETQERSIEVTEKTLENIRKSTVAPDY